MRVVIACIFTMNCHACKWKYCLNITIYNGITICFTYVHDIRTHLCTHTHIHAHPRTHLHSHSHTRTHIRKHATAQIYAFASTHLHTHIYSHTVTRIYLHAHTKTHTHTHIITCARATMFTHTYSERMYVYVFVSISCKFKESFLQLLKITLSHRHRQGRHLPSTFLPV